MIKWSSSHIFIFYEFQSLKINLHQGLSFKIIYVICILDFSQALTLHVGVAILRAQRGFDFSDILKDECYLLEESMSSGIDLAVKGKYTERIKEWGYFNGIL